MKTDFPGKNIVLTSVALMIFFIYPCSLNAALPPYMGAELKVGVPHEIDLLDPALAENVGERQAAALIYEPLFTTNSKDVQSLLVYKYEVENDGTNLHIWLKPELTFSDGFRVTVDDVLESYRRILNPNFGSPYAHYLFPIKGAELLYSQKTDVLAGFEIISELEFILHFNVRVKEAIHWLSHPALSILPKRQAKTLLPIEQPIGTGPFVVEQKTPFVLELRARDDYHNGKAFIRTLSFIYVDEKEKERDKLLNGKIDAVLYGRLFGKSDFKRIFSTLGSDVLVRFRWKNKLEDQKKFLKSLIDCKNIVELFEKRKINQIAGSSDGPVFGNVKQPDNNSRMFLGLLKMNALYSCQGFNHRISEAKQIYKRLFNEREITLRVEQHNKELELVAKRIALLAEQNGIAIKVQLASKVEMAEKRQSENWDMEIAEAPSARLSFSRIKDNRVDELVLYRLSAGLLVSAESDIKGVSFNVWGLVDFASVSRGGK